MVAAGSWDPAIPATAAVSTDSMCIVIVVIMSRGGHLGFSTCLAGMPGGPAPQAQQAVAGRALCTCVGPRLLRHHEGTACGVGAVELAGLWNGRLRCQLQTHKTETETRREADPNTRDIDDRTDSHNQADRQTD